MHRWKVQLRLRRPSSIQQGEKSDRSQTSSVLGVMPSYFRMAISISLLAGGESGARSHLPAETFLCSSIMLPAVHHPKSKRKPEVGEVLETSMFRRWNCLQLFRLPPTKSVVYPWP